MSAPVEVIQFVEDAVRRSLECSAALLDHYTSIRLQQKGSTFDGVRVDEEASGEPESAAVCV
jgi:hypothetical protein